MDSNPQSVKPMSDDQELAKVLAGVGQTTDEPLQFETTPITPTVTPPAPADPVAALTDTSTDDAIAPAETPEVPETEPQPEVAPAEPEEPAPAEEQPEPSVPAFTPPVTPVSEPAATSSSDLTSIKKDALNDLRPLVDKLEIAPEEKFDTYLLLIRSTDDKTLIAPAYAAAQAIPDEARKAQALLDVIKEIDYLSNPPQ